MNANPAASPPDKPVLRQPLAKLFEKYGSEFLLIFISTMLAFSLTEWSSREGEKVSEQKILAEINNGIRSDLEDFKNNVNSHNRSLRGIAVLRDWINRKNIPQDSVELYYYILFRNYTPIINTSAYESLKSTGLKTIENDTLRFQIIKLYDFHYRIIEKLEDQNAELQDFTNFYKPINTLLHPYFQFDTTGKLSRLLPPTRITPTQQTEIASYLWRMERNRRLKLNRYAKVLLEIARVSQNIDAELNRIN
jgi:hypothetical protein